MVSPWICSSLCAGGPEGSSWWAPWIPAAPHSNPDSVVTTHNLNISIIITLSWPQMHHETFVFVCVCIHSSSVLYCNVIFVCISKFSLFPPISCLQPAQLCARPGPCDWCASPPLWHSPGCGLHDGRSRWTPGKVLRSAHKGVAGLWFTASDRQYLYISMVSRGVRISVLLGWTYLMLLSCITKLYVNSYVTCIRWVCSPLPLKGIEGFPESRADLTQQLD